MPPFKSHGIYAPWYEHMALVAAKRHGPAVLHAEHTLYGVVLIDDMTGSFGGAARALLNAMQNRKPVAVTLMEPENIENRQSFERYVADVSEVDIEIGEATVSLTTTPPGTAP